MKKQLRWLVLIVLLAILSAAAWVYIGAGNSGNNPSEYIAAEDQPVSVRNERFKKMPNEEFFIDIVYPVVSGLSNTDIEADLNESIRSLAFRDYDYYKEELGDFYLEVSGDYYIIGGRIICCTFYTDFYHRMSPHPWRGISPLVYAWRPEKHFP